MPTVVAAVEVFTSVCLCIRVCFSARYLKNRCS